jgi:hypothetical protein
MAGGMTTVQPTIEVFWNVVEGDGVFRLDDATDGVLAPDASAAPLAGFQAVDITDRCYSMRTRRGRARELDEIEAGSLTVGVRNYDAAFLDDTFLDSILTDDDGDPLTDDNGDPLTTMDRPFPAPGSFDPGRRVRVSVASTVIFDGTIDDWDYDYRASGEVDAGFVAFDALGDLAAQGFPADKTWSAGLPGARFTDALNEIGWPLASRDIGTGSSSLQGDDVAARSNVLTYLRTVAQSDLGRLFAAGATGFVTFRDRDSVYSAGVSAVFSDQGSDIPFQALSIEHGSELLYTRVSVTREGGDVQTVSNAAAILAENGKVRDLNITWLLLDSDDEALAMANYLLSLYSTNSGRIASIGVSLDSLTSGQRTTLAELELGDVVTVTWQATGAPSAVTTANVVEAIEHVSTFATTHDVMLGLSPLDASLILDDAALGVLGSGLLAF